MVDLSVFRGLKTFADYQNEKRARALQEQAGAAKLQNMAIENDLMQARATALAEGRTLGGDLPATIKIANEIQQALSVGDTNRANLLMQVHKTLDRGILPYGSGSPMQAPSGGMGDGGFQPQPMPDSLPPALPAGQKPTAQRAPQDVSPQLMDEIMGGFGYNQPTPMQQPVGVMPGYGDAVSSIAAQKKAAEERAKLEQQFMLQPRIEAEKTRAKELAKEEAVTESDLLSRKSRMPQLIGVAKDLSKLGETATYTTTGKGRDLLYREMGLGETPQAVARTEYITRVDNEVLPLLRETFGAQFTENEGKSLRATLGDPDKGYEAKNAVLRSFLESKMQSINTQARRLNQPLVYSEDEIKAVVGSFSGKGKPLFERGKTAFDISKKLRDAGYTKEQIEAYKKAKGL